jgi:hypothetical protein
VASRYTGIFVFDMDGVLADCSHRMYLLKGRPKPDWPGFFALAGRDAPIAWGLDLLHTLASHDLGVTIWTGRSESIRDMTRHWLDRHHVSPSVGLRMRPDGDRRPGIELKQTWLQAMPLRPIMAIDDDPATVEMFRNGGVPCLHVERNFGAKHQAEGTEGSAA